MKYLLLTDNSVGWFSCIAKLDENNKVLEDHDISSVRCPFLTNLFNRDSNNGSIALNLISNSCHHWNFDGISEYEFERLKKLVKLLPAVQEYERLGRLS